MPAFLSFLMNVMTGVLSNWATTASARWMKSATLKKDLESRIGSLLLEARVHNLGEDGEALLSQQLEKTFPRENPIMDEQLINAVSDIKGFTKRIIDGHGGYVRELEMGGLVPLFDQIAEATVFTLAIHCLVNDKARYEAELRLAQEGTERFGKVDDSHSKLLDGLRILSDLTQENRANLERILGHLDRPQDSADSVNNNDSRNRDISVLPGDALPKNACTPTAVPASPDSKPTHSGHDITPGRLDGASVGDQGKGSRSHEIESTISHISRLQQSELINVIETLRSSYK
ncbi:MAG: hypothetical protein EOM68_20800 [Spirochaetia bacterium]|nr:hypothetical protein [Spirochaetia bacterium]